MTIRPYEDRDLPDIISIFETLTPGFFHPDERADLIQYLSSEIEDYFVICIGLKVCGCGGLNYFEEHHEVRISWDMVHEQHRGKGVGKLLTEFRIQKAKELPWARKMVVRTSQHAQSFYTRFGFKVVEVKPHYWARGLDMIYMELSV